jgi:class 3 adenylate cyclase
MSTLSLSRPRDASRVSRSETSREVDVTLLFCDVSHSTDLTARLGDRRAYRVIHRWHDTVIALARRYGGRELELRGDGALLAFAAPDAGVACAVGIQHAIRLAFSAADEQIEVHIGLHCGPALPVPHGYFGRTVIVSSRIADHAGPGEILVSAPLRDRLGEGNFRFDAVRSLELKGIAERCGAFPLIWGLAPTRAKSCVTCSPFPDNVAAPTLGRARGLSDD